MGSQNEPEDAYVMDALNLCKFLDFLIFNCLKFLVPMAFKKSSYAVNTIDNDALNLPKPEMVSLLALVWS